MTLLSQYSVILLHRSDFFTLIQNLKFERISTFMPQTIQSVASNSQQDGA